MNMNTHEMSADNTIEIEKLDALRASLAIGKYHEYPDNGQRLVADAFETNDYGRLVLPQGPWELDTKPMPAERYKELAQRGFAFDSQGGPLHPLFDKMVRDPAIGVFTGRGFFWEYGPNEAAEAIPVRRDLGDEPWVLLIQRKDSDQFAFMGGFTEGKSVLETAVAEGGEEGLISLASYTDTARLAYQGAVADIRTTANAWIETNAMVFELPPEATWHHTELVYKGGDDAKLAFWVPWSHVEEIVQPAHKIIARAIAPIVLG